MNLRQCTKQPSGAMPKRNIRLGIVIMMGGTICGNNVGLAGGEVVVWNGEFTMSGGEITQNKAGELGGGVSVMKNGIFSMSGGEISNNRSGGTGGGVNVIGAGTKFNKTGGKIFGNETACGDEVHESLFAGRF